MSWYSRLARCGSLLGVLVLLAAPRALAANVEPPPTEIEASGSHHAHLILGMKGVNTIERVATPAGVSTLSGYGFAAVAETAVLHGRLGLELDLVFTAPGNEMSIAGEPMLKLPWHLRSWCEPYVAAGPLAVRIRDERGGHFWMGGGQLAFGLFLWIAEMAGIDLDVSLGAAHGPEISMAEVTIAVGPVLRD
jgi:hypothetical protein